jgi:hypothetical protein
MGASGRVKGWMTANRALRLAFAAAVTAGTVMAQDAAAQARRAESEGNPLEAQRLLREAAGAANASPATLLQYAQFLDRYHKAGARAAYEKAASALAAGAEKTAALRRAVILQLLEGDHSAANRTLAAYRAAGGTDLGESVPVPAKKELPLAEIPGPLSSFARMAALSPDLKPEELLPALARNIVTNGYQASNSNEGLDQTEYLKLIFRYLSQARELEKLSGENRVIRVEVCDAPQTGDLLKVLGYRMRGACGGEVVLETVNASRAFLTIDSGFPLAELELALRTNRPFTLDYKPTPIPVLYGPDYWMAGEKKKDEFIDSFLSDPSICRLYLGLSKLDEHTAEELKKAIPVQRLRAFAHVLDFFGGMFLIRDGKAMVPGNEAAVAAWTELVGVGPEKGVEFYDKLVAKDDGWLTSYFDALMRLDGPVRDYLTEPNRMKRFYAALRGRVTSPGPARPVFRSNTDLMLLTTRLRLESDGEPHVPGGIEVWKNLFVNHPHGKYDGKLTKLATAWKTADDVLEALFALCRKAVENEPLKIYMAISDMNRYRAKPLEPATVDRLARAFRQYGAQYTILAEAPYLSDAAILQFLAAADGIGQIRDQGLRADVAGTFQALVGLWQIFARNRLIPGAESEGVLNGLTAAFTKVRSDSELFEAGRAGVLNVMKAAGASAGNAQDRMFELLTGTLNPRDQEAHTLMVQDMTRLFDSQKLISLKTILDIADHTEALAKGEKLNVALLNRLNTRMQEIQLPRASLTTAERNALSFGYWTERHIDRQRKFNVRAEVERAGNDPAKLKSARAGLAPILRDTLVGFNYLYYAPPGAQILRTNPLFARSHDFLGVQGTNQTWRNTEVLGTGWPSSAGGRLVGSLAGLSYAIAEAEQNFLVPSREQALIWGDLVPQMILSAKSPRWWNVTPRQMHWVGLHLREGESMIAESVLSAAQREKVLKVLAKQAAPNRVAKVESMLREGDITGALENVTPAELYMIAGSERHQRSPAAAEISRMAMLRSAEFTAESISSAFGTPKPTLTNSNKASLLFLRTFPTLMGYSSRIMAESWESNTLYFAALADELHLDPGRLCVSIPEWTQHTVERIFATHLEDWPALLRSLRVVGAEVRSRGRDASLSLSSGGL